MKFDAHADSEWMQKLLRALRRPSIIFSQDLSWHAMRTIGPHVHHFHQIDYFYKGHGHVQIGKQKYWVKPGDLFIANPKDRHGFQAARERPMEGITFKFTLGTRGSPVRFPNHVANLAALPGAQGRELESYLRRASTEANRRNFGHFEIAAALLSAFFVLLVRYLQADQQPLEASADRSASQTVLEYIRAHCDSTITLGDLGRLAKLNPRYLCQKFSRDTGMSPMAALTLARMERAQQLLANTRMSIGEVGMQSGYRDLYHFSKRFKDQVGVSPRMYRERKGRVPRVVTKKQAADRSACPPPM